MLDPRVFSEAFLAWVRGIREKDPGDVIALDGKTLRASMSEGQPALHVVSAWSAQNRIVLGQRAVDEKSNEITAIPELLKILELKGCIVTIDAMGCQKDIAKGVVARKADDLLAVKGNQEGLHKAILEALAAFDAEPSAVPHFTNEVHEVGHGRREGRRVVTLSALQHLPDKVLFAWAKLETLVHIQSETQRGGKACREDGNRTRKGNAPECSAILRHE